jgi:hypothetical protein
MLYALNAAEALECGCGIASLKGVELPVNL